ncbi:sperm microtubule associated protein 2-like isoform X1 [Lytechinus pictus]|uniref:sperm microtubule associated protein 2-like isoform X1 n=1 Tax=Lytechinus pictus TaxID=7653 RepID=UPI0030BA2282
MIAYFVGGDTKVLILRVTFDCLLQKMVRKQRPKSKARRKAHVQENSDGLSETQRDRFSYLSEHKNSKAIWLTSFGPKLEWGNQDTMWPVSRGAMTATATPRMEELSSPKKNFRSTKDGKKNIHVFSCGRNSVIWEVSPLAMKTSPTERLDTLSNYKRPPAAFKEDRPSHAFSCGRKSPIWYVSESAKKAMEKERLEYLARPKTPHREFVEPRGIETVVSAGAKNARASSRIEMLARPKSRPPGPFREPKWPVSDVAKGANATPRQLELAKPKNVADGYQADRPVQWSITRAARRANATGRTNELSTPIMRATMDHVQFNPDAFIVSDAAKKARCPPRIEELSQPLVR